MSKTHQYAPQPQQPATPTAGNYGAAQPVMGNVAGQQPGTTVYVQHVMAPPRGAPPGGHWMEDSYCGTGSIVVGICLFPCICFCPFDKRQVYVAPDGRKFDSNGHLV